MSRLYTWLSSDTRRTTLTSRGCEETDVTIHYGSRGDSKPLVDVHIYWKKGEDKPKVVITNHLEGMS